jgi:hypothetical protein
MLERTLDSNIIGASTIRSGPRHHQRQHPRPHSLLACWRSNDHCFLHARGDHLLGHNGIAAAYTVWPVGVILPLFFSSVPVKHQYHTAPTCHGTDVQNTINSAGRGDTAISSWLSQAVHLGREPIISQTFGFETPAYKLLTIRPIVEQIQVQSLRLEGLPQFPRSAYMHTIDGFFLCQLFL